MMSREWSKAIYTNPDIYFKEIWTTFPIKVKEYCILIRRDGVGFWVSPTDSLRSEKDIGPFDTFEAAAACFETVTGE
jgi:hypothetical protein